MKFEIINTNKFKVIFDITELEKNNISLHSFLSNSEEAKKFISSIINIIISDFNIGNFSDNLSQIRYDIISYKNKIFIIYISLELDNSRIFKFNNLDELNNFSTILKNYVSSENFETYIFKDKNSYFLKLIAKENSNFNAFEAIISEL